MKFMHNKTCATTINSYYYILITKHVRPPLASITTFITEVRGQAGMVFKVMEPKWAKLRTMKHSDLEDTLLKGCPKWEPYSWQTDA